MKLKFILFVFLLLFARGCDFYSTSLWIFEPDGLQSETNPLTRFFGIGWNGLIVANVIVISIVILAFYFYSFRYKTARLKPDSGSNYREYASLLYYKKKGQLYQLFYRLPSNKKAMIAHSGYVLVRVIIFASLLATIHNLGQYYQLSFYVSFRNLVGRPLYVIYALIIASFVLTHRHLLIQEYRVSKTS